MDDRADTGICIGELKILSCRAVPRGVLGVGIDVEPRKIRLEPTPVPVTIVPLPTAKR